MAVISLKNVSYRYPLEENQGIKIACLEEVAYNMGFLTKEDIMEQIKDFKNNEYYDYVKRLVEQNP